MGEMKEFTKPEQMEDEILKLREKVSILEAQLKEMENRTNAKRQAKSDIDKYFFGNGEKVEIDEEE